MGDVDVLKHIDTLNLNDFFKVSMLGSRFRQLIEDHNITDKYALHSQEIFLSVTSVLVMQFASDSNPTVIIDQPNEILFAIQQYGHLFKSLQIDIDLNEGFDIDVHLDQVQSLVSQYCSNAIQTITIYSFSAYYLSNSNLNISFPNAVAVHLIFEYNDSDEYVHSSSVALDKAFPRVERLYVSHLVDINYNFPHLKHFYMDASHTNVNATDLINFMRLNPQLETMLTPIPNYPTFFTTVTELLPRLESLFVVLLPDSALQMGTFHGARFPQLKQFSIDAGFMGDWFVSSRTLREVLDSLHFDCIEVISVGTDSSGLLDIMIEKLLLENETVKEIKINANATDNQLSLVISRLPELKNLTVISRDP